MHLVTTWGTVTRCRFLLIGVKGVTNLHQKCECTLGVCSHLKSAAKFASIVRIVQWNHCGFYTTINPLQNTHLSHGFCCKFVDFAADLKCECTLKVGFSCFPAPHTDLAYADTEAAYGLYACGWAGCHTKSPRTPRDRSISYNPSLSNISLLPSQKFSSVYTEV